MKLYRIRWKSLHNFRITAIESPRLLVLADAKELCERLNKVYANCVHHWYEEAGTDASPEQA